MDHRDHNGSLSMEQHRPPPQRHHLQQPPGQPPQTKPRKFGAYKLVSDPALRGGTGQKVYRYDGQSQDPLEPTPTPRDPRSRIQKLFAQKISMDLPLPKFKVDAQYVGTVPPRELTFSNLNDNIDEEFLKNLCAKYGPLDQVKIYYNPDTRKSMGLAKVVFTTVRAARNCADQLDQQTKMGQVMRVDVDTGGVQRKKLYDLMSRQEKKYEPVPMWREGSGSKKSTSSGPVPAVIKAAPLPREPPPPHPSRRTPPPTHSSRRTPPAPRHASPTTPTKIHGATPHSDSAYSTAYPPSGAASTTPQTASYGQTPGGEYSPYGSFPPQPLPPQPPPPSQTQHHSHPPPPPQHPHHPPPYGGHPPPQQPPAVGGYPGYPPTGPPPPHPSYRSHEDPSYHYDEYNNGYDRNSRDYGGRDAGRRPREYGSSKERDYGGRGGGGEGEYDYDDRRRGRGPPGRGGEEGKGDGGYYRRGDRANDPDRRGDYDNLDSRSSYSSRDDPYRGRGGDLRDQRDKRPSRDRRVADYDPYGSREKTADDRSMYPPINAWDPYGPPAHHPPHPGLQHPPPPPPHLGLLPPPPSHPLPSLDELHQRSEESEEEKEERLESLDKRIASILKCGEPESGGKDGNSDAETSLEPVPGADSSFGDVKPAPCMTPTQDYASPTTTTATPDYKRDTALYHSRGRNDSLERNTTPDVKYDAVGSKHSRADVVLASSEVSSSSARVKDELDDQKYRKTAEVTRRPADTSTRGATPLDDDRGRYHHQQQPHYHHRSGRSTGREDGEMSGSDMDVEMDRPSSGEGDHRGFVGDKKNDIFNARRRFPPTIAQASSSSSSPRTPKPSTGTTPTQRANGGATMAEADSLAPGASPLVSASVPDSSTPSQQHRSPLGSLTPSSHPPPVLPQLPGRPPLPPPPLPSLTALASATPTYASTPPTSTSTTSQPTATDYMSYHDAWAQNMGARAAAANQRYYDQHRPKDSSAHPPPSPYMQQHPYQQYQQQPPPTSGPPPPLMQTDQRVPPFVPSTSSSSIPSVDPQEKTLDKAVTRLAVDLKAVINRDLNSSMIRNAAFKLFDAWYEDNEKKNRQATQAAATAASCSSGTGNSEKDASSMSSTSNLTSSASATTVASTDREFTTSCMINAWESMDPLRRGQSTGGAGGFLGLKGLSFNKMSSFRIKKHHHRAPSPTTTTREEDEEKDEKRDEEEEEEEEKRRRLREDESDEDEDDKEDRDDDSDAEEMRRKRRLERETELRRKEKRKEDRKAVRKRRPVLSSDDDDESSSSSSSGESEDEDSESSTEEENEEEERASSRKRRSESPTSREESEEEETEVRSKKKRRVEDSSEDEERDDREDDEEEIDVGRRDDDAQMTRPSPGAVDDDVTHGKERVEDMEEVAEKEDTIVLASNDASFSAPPTPTPAHSSAASVVSIASAPPSPSSSSVPSTPVTPRPKSTAVTPKLPHDVDDAVPATSRPKAAGDSKEQTPSSSSDSRADWVSKHFRSLDDAVDNVFGDSAGKVDDGPMSEKKSDTTTTTPNLFKDVFSSPDKAAAIAASAKAERQSSSLHKTDHDYVSTNRPKEDAGETEKEEPKVFLDHAYCLPSSAATAPDKTVKGKKKKEEGVSSPLRNKENTPSASSTPPRKSVKLEVFTEWDAQSVTKSSPKFSEWTSPSAPSRLASGNAASPLSAPPPPRAAATVAAAAVYLSSRPLPPVQPPPPKPKPVPTYKQRPLEEELKVFYDFLVRGIDAEDTNYLKRVYEMFLSQDEALNRAPWLNEVTWVPHCPTYVPDPTRREKKKDKLKPHASGSARTEGYYKQRKQDKTTYLHHSAVPTMMGMGNNDELNAVEEARLLKERARSVALISREARSNQRRYASVLGDDFNELFKFSQLKLRKKHLRFARSHIHDWGLFALEPIAPEEMIIEYTGEVIRVPVADAREKKYARQGIGSSYFFRVERDHVIDATKFGNLARFINHCCDPTCYAKVISAEGAKKIVIYSKVAIDVNEEITYDYKFPLEEEKIKCLCGAINCRGYLN